MSVIICAINCGKIILIQLIYYFHIFHYFSLFSLFFVILSSSLFAFLLQKVVHIYLWHGFKQWNVLSFNQSFNIICLVLFHSFGVHRPFGLWYCIWNAAHKFLGGYVLPSEIWVIFRSPRVTYYISYMFGFNVNNHIFILSNLKL